MTRLIFVDTGKEINQDVMSLMAFLVETYSDRQILLALEEALYNSLTKEFKKSSYLIVPFTEKLISSGDEVVVFQNSNYDKIKRDIARGAINDKIVKLFMPDAFFLTESNIFRNETSSYFTFSPFQDTQRFFSSLSDGSSIKRQLCIRYINKGDLTNPLFMSVHICYSYQRYSYENQWKNICFVIDILSNEYLIEKNRILIRYHKSCKAYIQPQMEEYKTEMCDDDNFVAHLNIPGTHFYVKVFYEHDNGLLPFVNFVLVDIRNNLSKLDSIIYQDRLELIKESKTYIMELDRYKRLVEEVTRNQPQLLNQELHELTNHFIAIFSLLYMRIKGSNKGVENIMLLIFFYNIFNCHSRRFLQYSRLSP